MAEGDADVIRIGESSTGTVYADMEEGRTTDGHATKRPLQHEINSDDIKSAVETLQAAIGALVDPAAGSSNKLLTDILAKIIAAPATEATLAALLASWGDAEASPDANTSQARLKALADALGTNTDAPASGTQDTTEKSAIAELKGMLNQLNALAATLGATDGAAVITDANGTAQQYLRGLVKLWIAGLPAGTNLMGNVGIDQVTASANEVVVKSANKGSVTTAHSEISDTATSAEIDCRGFNSLIVYAGPFTAAENWTFKIQGSMTSGGVFVDMYEMANTGSMALMSYQCNAARAFVLHGMPDYIKVVATRDGGASTITCKVQPFNA